VRWLVSLSLLVLTGCRKDPPEPAPPEVVRSSALASASASAAGPVGSRRREALGRPAPVGGRWLSCYGSFAPQSDPRLDVGRLAQACGPPNGMVKAASFAGELHADAGPPGEHRYTAREGECFRVFAVADPAIEDLDIEVFDSSRRRVAFDDGDDRWPVVRPDGPFCAFDAGEQLIRVKAAHGGGRYAIELWRLAR
jgi:hypothetical protein